MSTRKNNTVSLRVQVSVLLVAFAAFAWILPDRNRSASELLPSEMITALSVGTEVLTVDQVARYVVNEDETIQLIDIRQTSEFLSSHIPGAINIPFEDILDPDWSGYMNDPSRTAVLYANGSTLAAEAWMLCSQVGYNVKIMDGGMNKWFELVMESEFTGEQITATENALFENRYKARHFFTTINSLPDSLKIAFQEVKNKKESELVGGCE